MEQPTSFGLRLRIPGWCHSAKLSVNGEPIELAPRMECGYVKLERLWHPSDRVQLDLDMPVEQVYAHPDVRQDSGQIALQRGPLVYCLEAADHSVPLQRIVMPREATLSSHFEASLLGGVTVITGEGLAADTTGWENALYRKQGPDLKPCALTAIPYYAWDNRQAGQMRVWLPLG